MGVRPLDRAVNSLKQCLLVDGFAQKTRRACLQRPPFLLLAGSAAEKDDRNPVFVLGQTSLQLQAVCTRHVHIEQQTVRLRQAPRLQKLFCGRERLSPQRRAAKEPLG